MENKTSTNQETANGIKSDVSGSASKGRYTVTLLTEDEFACEPMEMSEENYQKVKLYAIKTFGGRNIGFISYKHCH